MNAAPAWSKVSASVSHYAQEAGMRAVVTIAVLACALATALFPSAARSQGLSAEEGQALREEIRRLNERLNRLELAGQSRVPPATASVSSPAVVTPAAV